MARNLLFQYRDLEHGRRTIAHQLSALAGLLIAVASLTTARADTIGPRDSWIFDMQPKVHGVELNGPLLVNAFPLGGQGLEYTAVRVVRDADIEELMAQGTSRQDAIGSVDAVEGTLELWKDDRLLAWLPAAPLEPATSYTIELQLNSNDPSPFSLDVVGTVGFTTLADGQVGDLPTLSHVGLELDPVPGGCNMVIAHFRLRDGDIPSPYLRLTGYTFPNRATTIAGVGRPLTFSQIYRVQQDTYCITLDVEHLISGDTARLEFCADHDESLNTSSRPFCPVGFVEPDDIKRNGCAAASPLPFSLVLGVCTLLVLMSRRRKATRHPV